VPKVTKPVKASPKQIQKPKGYWTDIKNQRSFFDQLAAKLNVQHLDDWHKVPQKTVLNEGGYFVNYMYKGNVIKGKNP
jgi:hypothetical protein